MPYCVLSFSNEQPKERIWLLELCEGEHLKKTDTRGGGSGVPGEKERGRVLLLLGAGWSLQVFFNHPCWIDEFFTVKQHEEAARTLLWSFQLEEFVLKGTCYGHVGILVNSGNLEDFNDKERIGVSSDNALVNKFAKLQSNHMYVFWINLILTFFWISWKSAGFYESG